MRRNLLIINLLCSFFLLAQSSKPSLFVLRKSLEPTAFLVLERPFPPAFSEPLFDPKSLKPTSVLCKKYAPDELAFFCRIEYRMAKKSASVPFKFRLGSVEYVDFLEGK